ncbi:MAG: GntR family transcriptional regulator [Verrucomicrobiaceae bacterium]|jgi:predicted RNA-binding protein (virulence factor B family)|nr:MAG: GntR family transcriptional regulator [Verrucomicrobiaceae bacterium]
MAKIGERASLKILREKSFGLYLDGGELGEVLLPHREVPKDNVIGAFLDVFLYTDSEDRPVATLKTPMAIPGEFAKLKCVAVTGVGAFLDWGLAKELLVPFREQKARMEPGKSYLVHVHVDKVSGRIIASARLSRHLDLTPHSLRRGDEVELVIFGKTALGYKAIINGTHSGLLFTEGVFQPLQPGEKTKGYVSGIREDGKIDLTLHAPGRAKVEGLEERILAELQARGGFWGIGDHSSAAEIHDELGVSKRTFKQAVGSLFRKRLISIEERGIRMAR